MNNKIKEALAKGLIVFTGFLLVFTSICFPIMATYLGYAFEETEKMWICLWIITLMSGVVMMVTLTTTDLDAKPTPPENMPIKFCDYNTFLVNLHDTLVSLNYIKLDTSANCSSVSVELYINTSNCKRNCYALIRLPELKEENVQHAEETITRMMKESKSSKRLMWAVNMTSIFCVDRITPTFKKLLNDGVQQEYNKGRLLVGISFGGKKAYIAKPKGSFAFIRYKQLRKAFIGIIQGQGNGSVSV